MKGGWKRQQNRIGLIRNIRRIVRDVITIITYAYLAMWLWQWNKEYINNVRNNMTMGYGLLCLVWSLRLSPRSVFYSVFVVGLYGWMIKWMWWSVNEIGCGSVVDLCRCYLEGKVHTRCIGWRWTLSSTQHNDIWRVQYDKVRTKCM